jgi:hypothetical protein
MRRSGGPAEADSVIPPGEHRFSPEAMITPQFTQCSRAKDAKLEILIEPARSVADNDP